MGLFAALPFLCVSMSAYTADGGEGAVAESGAEEGEPDSAEVEEGTEMPAAAVAEPAEPDPTAGTDAPEEAPGEGGDEDLYISPSQLLRQQREMVASRTGSKHGGNIRGKTLSDLSLTIDEYGVYSWSYPINPSYEAGSPYGPRISPIDKVPVFHPAQDIGCTTGDPIIAVADGVVQISHHSESAGKYVEIDHGTPDGRKVVSRYLHMSTLMVAVGDEVTEGQTIGLCGDTGRATGPHLHFAIWIDGNPVPPFVTNE